MSLFILTEIAAESFMLHGVSHIKWLENKNRKHTETKGQILV